MKTDGWGVIRSSKGLILSVYAQSAQNKVQDMNEVIAQLEQALSLARSLNQAANSAQNEPIKEKVQSAQLKESIKNLAQPALIQAAPEGIASATPKSQLHTAGENIHLVSGENTDISSGQDTTIHATERVNVFA